MGVRGESRITSSVDEPINVSQPEMLQNPAPFDEIESRAPTSFAEREYALSSSRRSKQNTASSTITDTDKNINDKKPDPTPPRKQFASSIQRIRMWSVNARKLLRRRAELEARLHNANVDLLCVQETWLSDSIEYIVISGYYLVGRLDRILGPKKGFGGIAIFAKNSFTSVSLGEYSICSERMWCNLHTNIGTFLIGNWYRPPDDNGSSLESLPEELSRLSSDAIATILLGDMNIHHKNGYDTRGRILH